MKKIVGLIGSPRRSGNSELVVKEISRNIPEEHELLLINLSKIRLKPCTGCYQCLFNGGQCHLKDDMSKVLETLREAEGVILAAPTYFLGVNGIVKVFSDRAMVVLPRIEEFFGKPAVVAVLAGMEGKEGCSEMNLTLSASSFGFSVKNRETFYAALPGEVLIGDENREKAARLGKVLLDPGYVREPRNFECSLCSGNTFRFLGDDLVECLSCHNSGRIRWEGERFRMEMGHISHNILGSLEDRIAHRAWLMGMKEKFSENKKMLKGLTSGYLEDGRWIDMKQGH